MSSTKRIPKCVVIEEDEDAFDKHNQNDYLSKVQRLYSKDVSFFINRNKAFMKELGQIDEALTPKIQKIKENLPKNDKIFDLIMKSFNNIQNYNYDKRKFTKEERILMANNIKSVLLAVDILLTFLLDKNVKKSSKMIESLLFKLIFNPIKSASNTTSVYSVYMMHNEFIYNQSSFINFKSSTGSGKTRCAPFFFAIRMIEEGMDKPFFIMTQPSYSIILDKYKDFKNVLGSTVHLVKDIKEMLLLYQKHSRLVSEEKTKTKAFKKYFSRPIVGLFSPHVLLTLISKTDKNKIDIVQYTRFCLDEFHERSVDTDVLIAVLSEKMKKMVHNRTNFPMQVLMMSATPDPRVLNCFGHVEELSLPNSQLFNIDDINITVDTKRKVDPEVISQTFEVIKRMASGTLDKGHILIFTSGNSRITGIQNNIISDCEKKCSQQNTIVKVIDNFEIMLKGKTVKQFYAKLDKYIKQQEKHVPNKKVLFVLPIKYLGYVSDEQKEIGKSLIHNHDNVIKVIIATNAIESSITIENLAAVVDSCLFNRPLYDKDKGLTTLEENPISIQSQTQRRGRVGRVRPGIYVKIMIKNNSLIDLLPPEIQTTDITLNILSLRSIGFDLERITNLPDKVDKNDMNRYITELKSFGALDSKTSQITKLGKLLGSFSAISPFIVTAILKVAGYKVEEENDKIIVIRVLLGFLISLIFGDSNLCINSYSPKLQNNYDQESDISTILMTFLDLMLHQRKEVKECSEEYGFNSKSVSSIIGQVIQTAELLPFFKKQAKEEMKKKEEEMKNKRDEEIVADDDKEENNDETEKSRVKKKKSFDPNSLNRKTIFKHLHQYAKSLKLNHKLNEFITKLIHEIGKNKPEWMKCRIVQFFNCENLYSNPSIIYIGDKSLSFEDEERALIYMRMRPGTFGLDCPVAGYILSIAHEENVRMNFGSLFHYDPSLPNAKSIVHPISIQCPFAIDNDFADPLIEGYLSEDENNFKKFCRGTCTGAESGNILFFRSQGMISNQICSIFTFIPKSKEAFQIFSNALKAIEQLIPYTPSTILVPDHLLKCFVSIRGVGTNKIDSSVHLFKDNQYHAYQINRDSINYAIKNIQKLKSPIEQMTIAITGEKYSYQLSATEDEIEDKTKQNNYYPQVNSKCSCVFSDDPFFHSHLVLLSHSRISSGNGKINELTWLKSGISVEYSNDELIANAANNISRDLVSIRKGGTCFIYSTSSSELVIKGNVPTLNDATMYFREAGISRFQEKRPVGTKMDLFAMHYIKGDTLLPSFADNFKSFFYKGNNLGLEVDIVPKNKYRTAEEIECEINNVNQQIGILKDKKTMLKQQIGNPLVNQKQNKTQVIQTGKQLTELFNKLDELKSEHEKAKENAKKRPIITQHCLNNLKSIEQINFKKLGHGCICIETGSINPDEIKNRALCMIKQVHPDVEVETIQIYQIMVKHQSHSKLNKEDFVQRVKEVSDKFGAIVSRIGKYRENNNVFNKRIKGTIPVFIYTTEFTFPFAGMIKKAFQVGSQYSILRIPKTIVDPYILRDSKVNDYLKKWFSSNKLRIQQNGCQWFGEEKDVEKALQQFNENPPKIPYNSFPLPTETNILVVRNRISRYKKSSAGAWYINRLSKTLFVPSSIPLKQVQEFIETLQIKHDGDVINDDANDGIESILGDINSCEEDAELSRNYINVYLKGGKIVQKNYCVSCVKDMFLFNLRKMFNASENDISMEEIINDYEFLSPVDLIAASEDERNYKHGDQREIFPFFSFGQIFYSFINEDKISNMAKAWITATAVKAIRKSQYFTFCPCHPNILIPRPAAHGNIRCISPGCGYFLCSDCDSWHTVGNCTKKKTIPPGFRVCPYCHEAVEKSMACNYLACRCGKAFCYYCGKGLSEGNHSVNDHGDCYNNPPDYRKYVLGESISNDVLEKFYREYPQWRPDAGH